MILNIVDTFTFSFCLLMALFDQELKSRQVKCHVTYIKQHLSNYMYTPGKKVNATHGMFCIC